MIRRLLGRPPAPLPDDLPDYADPKALQGLIDVLSPLRAWHRYEVRGLEHVPRSGRVLLVAHHSLATYDGFLLGLEIYEQLGRITRGLGDDRLFLTPTMARISRGVGIVPASPTAGRELLESENLVGVAPGGMWESLRPHTERYDIRWGPRRGFVKLALRTGSPMVLAACPRADEIFKVYPSRITDRIYQAVHMPAPVLRGLGPSLLPRPVKLVHHVAPPLVPPPHDPAREEEQVEALFQRAAAVMRELLARR